MFNVITNRAHASTRESHSLNNFNTLLISKKNAAQHKNMSISLEIIFILSMKTGLNHHESFNSFLNDKFQKSTSRLHFFLDSTKIYLFFHFDHIILLRNQRKEQLFQTHAPAKSDVQAFSFRKILFFCTEKKQFEFIHFNEHLNSEHVFFFVDFLGMNDQHEIPVFNRLQRFI